MENLVSVLILSQLVFSIIGIVYFYNNIKSQKGTRKTITLESKKEMDKLKKMRSIQLTPPLSEKTRPQDFSEIIGQEKGVRALRAALCGPNPQHVIIYGPPGVGKTAAARLILEECLKDEKSPFLTEAPFIEMDATILQFDERSIADPLIGSVHDPIYQGSGTLGQAGIPQPKIGAVTKAHGGILFIDEIGELHNLQMNKLLKVLEDRTVFLNSAYYSKEEENMPRYIQDIFNNGLPADFRLIGATTRRPEEIPPALRSRCAEIFFKSLSPSEVVIISKNAIKRAGFEAEKEAIDLISKYSTNGRDTVNIIQTAVSICALDNREIITSEDIEEVIENGKYSPNVTKKISKNSNIGIVNGLGVSGANGMILEIEAIASPCESGKIGKLNITGIIDEEELNSGIGKIKRKSNVRSSLENVVTVLNQHLGINTYDYDLHVNFPGGMPVDGPSAGIAMFCAIFSCISKKEVTSTVAMTGEVSIKGKVLPVGGVFEKIEAAKEAGVTKVFVPKENYQKLFEKFDIEIIYINNVFELINELFSEKNIITEPQINFGI